MLQDIQVLRGCGFQSNFSPPPGFLYHKCSTTLRHCRHCNFSMCMKQTCNFSKSPKHYYLPVFTVEVLSCNLFVLLHHSVIESHLYHCRAAFQYGVKMSDGRKTRRAGPKDEKAALDREWQQIQNIMSKQSSKKSKY